MAKLRVVETGDRYGTCKVVRESPDGEETLFETVAHEDAVFFLRGIEYALNHDELHGDDVVEEVASGG